MEHHYQYLNGNSIRHAHHAIIGEDLWVGLLKCDLKESGPHSLPSNLALYIHKKFMLFALVKK